jgi:hypothetical protein
MEFIEFKNEILRRAKEVKACTKEYGRACKSDNFDKLMQVIKDNFDYAVCNKVIDPSLIKACKEQFNANQIYCNVDVAEGFLLACNGSTVKAYGSATVEAYDSATVEARNSSTVEAYGSATVKAYDSATIETYDSAYITSHHTIGCKLRGSAIYRIRESNTVRYASDSIKFERVLAYEPEGTEAETN